MTEESMDLIEYVRKRALDPEISDWLREAVRRVVQEVIESEVSEQIGARRHQRTPERTNQRNGYRERGWETRVGEVGLRIPKLRQGSYFPSLLEPRRKAEQALLAVVQSAYIEGVSTRKVDALVQSLGLTGIDRSRVSRICQELDEVVRAFRERPLEGGYPYVWLDALYVKVRQNHRIVNMAVVVALGVQENGEREVLGLAVGGSEEASFWQQFLRSLVRRGLQRGLKGVQLVISDAHEGLRTAIGQVLSGASWQRCRVHFMRNLLAYVPQGDKSVAAAFVRTVFAQPDRKAAGEQLHQMVELMERRWPQAARVLVKAEDDILAYLAFPPEHWSRIYSTNPLERMNKEIKRRVNVVGVFPDVPSVERLVGTLLAETHDEWQVERRYFSQESMRKLKPAEALAGAETVPLRVPPVH
jgi:putative transposase